MPALASVKTKPDMGNRATFALTAVVIALISLSMSALAAPAVSNVQAAQRPGSNLVDITYTLSGGNAAWVLLEVSSDGGAAYTVPTASATGHVDANVAQGSNRKITWNAGADWANQYSVGMKVKVTASHVPPAPAGMALIPAGSFQMGNQMASNEGYSNELPLHTVYVSAFYIERHEVTRVLWDEVRAWALTNGYRELAVGSGNATNHPVAHVSWNEAVRWCNARSQKEGLEPCYTVDGETYKAQPSTGVICNFSANGYRLPTEAEWEKAARGGLSGKRFPWGDTISHGLANYYVWSFNGGVSNAYGYDVSPTVGFHPTYIRNANNDVSIYGRSPVDAFAPNGYGLYDMAGNMWEWCWDWYSSSYYASSSASDPRGPSSGSSRVYRGGSWYGNAIDCRVARRETYYGTTPGAHTYRIVGFRCVRSSVP